MTEAIESDAKSVSPKPSQTRFNFYNAEDINRQVSKDDGDKNGDQEVETPKKETRRFNFYNAAEVNEAAGPIQFPKRPTSLPRSQQPLPAVTPVTTRSSSARKDTKRPPSLDPTPVSHQPPFRSPKSDIAVVSSNLKIDSNEILRSLQESERQRWRKKTSNQRTAPTQRSRNQIPTSNGTPKDKGILQTPTNNQDDVVMQSRMDVEGSSERREAERQSRKERMAMYASKILESKSETLSLSPVSPKKHWISTPRSLLHSEEVIMRRSESDHDSSLQDDDEEFDAEALIRQRSESVERVTENPPNGKEEEQSVEKVLSAILERSKVGKRKNVNHESELQALNKAMENLLQPTLSFETISNVRSRRPNRRESDEHNLQAEEEELKQIEEALDKQAVVDELLEPNVKDTPSTQNHTAEAPVTQTEAPRTPDTSTDDLEDECDVASDAASPSLIASHVAPSSYVDDENEDLLTDTDDEHEILEDDDDDDYDYGPNNVSLEESTLTNVLGPLSRGESTGVVLEAPEVPPLPPPPTEDGPAPLSPSSIYETLSSAVRDAESFMSFMTLGGYSSPTKDKYSTHDEDDENVQVESLDNEAHELMRSLCAHLLPFGVDKSCKHQSKNIPVWDESNPDEAGYRIIRLTKLQLRRVEREFNLMIKSVKQSSERDLDGRLKQTDDSDDWANRESNDDFERDLEEAEELLNQEEKRQEEADRAMTADEGAESQDESGSDTDSSAGSETEESSISHTMTNDRTQSPTASETDDDTLLTSHPVFPGVKTPGRGEIGDLEFFHLPIIYKSKVTGFEPTKDMCLDPGNVVAGQYLVESELGSAAFSTAYRCVDLSSETTNEDGGQGHDEVCLKVIKNTKDFFDQSLDEIKILELLRQTGKCDEMHVLEMKTFFYHREHLIIVTELLRQNLFEFGKCITDSAEEPYFTRPRLCSITRQVLTALHFVHKMGLVHSDVKPENILLSSYSRAQVKLIDFGSSCYLTDRQSSYIQSRSYRAPEVVLGLPYGDKIDIWSLGCVVAEMYTGEVTFQNDSIVSMLSRIEAICGPFPRHMIAQGRQSGQFFTKSGLLFENVEKDHQSDGHPTSRSQFDAVQDSALLDVFQPKQTTMAARLGIPEIITEDEALFVDFCSKVLAVDPDSRPTAEEALKHPWIVAGASLTEEDIKYPSN